MSTSYTSLLGFALPATGELSGTWGDTVNNSITSLLDSAIAGTTTIVLDQDVTLSNNDGTADTSRQAIILWTAGGSATRTITAPGQSKIYTVINASSGNQSIILNALATTGVTIAKGESALVAWNGSDFIKISNTAGPGTFTNLTVTGNTTLGDAVADTITVNSQFVTGTVLRSAQSLTNTLALAAYDVDGAAYTNLITLTAANAPTLALTSTGVGTINNMSIGATTASTGAFTTLSASGAVTIGGNTAVTGTLSATSNVYTAGRYFAQRQSGSLSFAIGGYSDGSAATVLTGAIGDIVAFGNVGGDGVIFANSNTERMRLTDTGLGIGVSSPGVKLDVLGGARFSGVSGTGTQGLRLYGTGTAYNYLNIDNTGANLTLGIESSAGGTLSTGSSAYASILQSYANYPLQFGTNNTIRATLSTSGNLGITETSPTAKLQISVASAAVNGTKGVRITNPAGTIVMLECGSGGDSFVGTESGSTFNIRTNNAINATFLTSGNVGIGETNPTQILHLKGSGTTYALAETTGSGTSSGFRMKAGAGTDFTLYTTQGGNQFGIYNNTTSAQPLTINANGALALLGASTSATGVGITFPATQSASTDANTLDDYEEGTFDPTITRSSSNPTVTYANQLGSYVKVGRLVSVTLGLSWSANSGGSGNFTISGLPFTNTNSADNYSQAFGVDMSGVTFAVGTTTLGGYVNVNTTTIFLTCAGSAVSSSAPTLGSSGYLYMSVAYMASA